MKNNDVKKESKGTKKKILVKDNNENSSKIQCLKPAELVKELDRYIIGQKEAKKAVSIALRNRYRRKLVEKPLRDDIVPKNILMIGSTGVGKTEIARRIAKLTDAPFVKVEATNFTEVGYVGRDVDTIIKELTDVAIKKERKIANEINEEKAKEKALSRLASEILENDEEYTKKFKDIAKKAVKKIKSKESIVQVEESLEIEEIDGKIVLSEEIKNKTKKELKNDYDKKFNEILKDLKDGKLDDLEVKIKISDFSKNIIEQIDFPEGSATVGMISMGELLSKGFGGGKKKNKKIKVSDALSMFIEEEMDDMIDEEKVAKIALKKVEEDGIVFIDEIDKVSMRDGGSSRGTNVSREGVQRDLLPLIEGTTINTKYGLVKTDHILFIASGSFHNSSVSDLLPEFQGRFPIRVQLNKLTQSDFVKILKEPDSSLVKQYTALMKTENIDLIFTQDGIEEMAYLAHKMNEEVENIGARRLHTLIEKILEDLSFEASELKPNTKINIDKKYVDKHIGNLNQKIDTSKFIL